MSIAGQLAVIAGLFAVVYWLHRRAKRTDFERLRAYHGRRKYRVVIEPAPGPSDGAAGDTGQAGDGDRDRDRDRDRHPDGPPNRTANRAPNEASRRASNGNGADG